MTPGIEEFLAHIRSGWDRVTPAHAANKSLPARSSSTFAPPSSAADKATFLAP